MTLKSEFQPVQDLKAQFEVDLRTIDCCCVTSHHWLNVKIIAHKRATTPWKQKLIHLKKLLHDEDGNEFSESCGWNGNESCSWKTKYLNYQPQFACLKDRTVLWLLWVWLAEIVILHCMGIQPECFANQKGLWDTTSPVRLKLHCCTLSSRTFFSSCSIFFFFGESWTIFKMPHSKHLFLKPRIRTRFMDLNKGIVKGRMKETTYGLFSCTWEVSIH